MDSNRSQADSGLTAMSPDSRELSDQLAPYGVCLYAEGRDFAEFSLPPYISEFSVVAEKLSEYADVTFFSDDKSVSIITHI